MSFLSSVWALGTGATLGKLSSYRFRSVHAVFQGGWPSGHTGPLAPTFLPTLFALALCEACQPHGCG